MGMGDDDVRRRLGEPMSERAIGGERWLVYSSEYGRLRLRLSPDAAGSMPVVRSLTIDLHDGGRDLSPLLERLGLMTTGPIEPVPGSEGRLLRGEVEASGRRNSLTASLRSGQIVAITVFDEAPDWREASGT
jgi:hypothetical protein